MSFELTARTEAGATLVALAESLADDFAERASCHDRDVRAGAFMHPLGANRAYELIGQVALGLEPALH
jgi:hypothetical protein